jgi:hypothetical protein
LWQPQPRAEALAVTGGMQGSAGQPSIHGFITGQINNVLLVKIEGPVWLIPSIIIYLLLKDKQTPLLTNQPMGKGHLLGKLRYFTNLN